MSRKSRSTAINKHSLFGPPPILEGEDAAAFDELYHRVCAVITTVDVIDEMFVNDFVGLEWEILRWRRLKLSLIRERGVQALNDFLCQKLEYNVYRENFTEELTTILRNNGVEDSAELVRKCAGNEPDAVDEVNHILDGIGLHLDPILNRAQAQKAKELAHGYFQGEADAVKLVSELLAGASVTMESLLLEALADQWDLIERIDCLATVAEGRRNASLREIDRRRALLGEALRRSVAEVEGRELDPIEVTPAEGKKSA
jgi:hypothetical protein